MKNLWAVAIGIPLIIIVIEAAIIVGVGELYLAIGETPAIIAAIVLMCAITAAAALFTSRMRGSH